MMDAKRARPSAEAAEKPPEQVTLIYTQIKGAHTFTAVEVPGLVIADHNFKRAFDDGLRGISCLVSMISNCDVKYEANFEAFKTKVEQQARTSVARSPVTLFGTVHAH